MAFAEEFYLHLQGEQKGPYTFADIKNLYDKNLIPEETLYWRDGFDQWQPVSDLCGPPLVIRRRNRRKTQLVTAVALLVFCLVAAYFGPLLREGWKETGPREYSREAAYWAARGFVREEMKRGKRKVSFESFSAATVDLTNINDARVSVRGTVFQSDGLNLSEFWTVAVQFDPAQKSWRLTARTPIETISP